MEVRVARASAVASQRVPPGREEWFLAWQRGVSAAAETFPGYRGADVYPPGPGQGEQWIAVIHFDAPEQLDAWLASPVRAQWVAKLRENVGDFELEAFSRGFGPWFACLRDAPDRAAPAGWKMALVVLLGLYPTVMVLTLFPGPLLAPLGLPVSMLLGNAMSIAILQWGVMPLLSAAFATWLTASGPAGRRATLLGLAVIAACLALLVLFFGAVAG
ncbi:hypothetical protein [Solidesulfovibrio sp.]|uniref:hypothetical protein n=1 Tax=Solidesulfovibrio sp. TaxID=2910990 RepID=UPI0026105DEA|nr:hypothetical protein [Solidesulfovibrio sp.]